MKLSGSLRGLPFGLYWCGGQGFNHGQSGSQEQCARGNSSGLCFWSRLCSFFWPLCCPRRLLPDAILNYCKAIWGFCLWHCCSQICLQQVSTDKKHAAFSVKETKVHPADCSSQVGLKRTPPDGEALMQTLLVCLSVYVNQGDAKQSEQRHFSGALSPILCGGMTPSPVSLSLFWVPSDCETGCSWQRSIFANWLFFPLAAEVNTGFSFSWSR